MSKRYDICTSLCGVGGITKEIRSRIAVARSASFHSQSCLLSWHEISFCVQRNRSTSKRLVRFCGRMQVVFVGNSIRHILQIRHRGRIAVPHSSYLYTGTGCPRSRWFGHVARTGGQFKKCAPAFKEDLEPLFGPRVFGYAR